jgi:chemotaxis protein methyltransferase CheR
MATSTAPDYTFLREVVFRHSQNILDSSCDYLFDTYLASLLRDEGMSGVDELIRRLRISPDPSLERAIAEAMTIKETSFFRDSRPFDLLRTELLPTLIEARRSTRSLRLWSAASSTGQEAYSLAMLLLEHFSESRSWNIRIEGTDISYEAIGKARRGVYHRIEMSRGVSARQMVRFFDQAGENWIAKPEIRQLCKFQHVNLCRPPLPFHDRFDVILLRNVLLYFSQETRRMLLAGVHRLLAADGILFLGSAEQPPESGLWKAVLAGGTCHYRPR